MKTIFVLCGLILAGALAWFALDRNASDHHGKAFQGLPAVGIGQLVAKPGDYAKKDVRIEGTVTRQCPSAGCWFLLKDGTGKEIKVEMGDTTPTLPQRAGKTATVEGQLIRFGDGLEFIGTAVEFR